MMFCYIDGLHKPQRLFLNFLNILRTARDLRLYAERVKIVRNVWPPINHTSYIIVKL